MPYQSLFPLAIIITMTATTAAGIAGCNYLENGKWTRRPNANWFEKAYDAREAQVRMLEREKARAK
eukprot:CAMPEP_0172444736 /NCGR_PEP_ID=MMETSP1065-20121228/4750_1 /TAXON_ID=265537 /ORGANISM="Amphiprora paludosa, Strain CCMP125" /LENGTH=65 /DNA_ID=CAMNT_0013195407 /DNA_START=94 /DNA_END=291 /DNA_ORIENTATION=-